MGFDTNIYTRKDNGIWLVYIRQTISTEDRVVRMGQSYCFKLVKFRAWLTMTDRSYDMNVGTVITLKLGHF